MGSETLYFDARGNGWSSELLLVEPWFVDADETQPYTQATALAALIEDAADYDRFLDWAAEQGAELPDLFERLPVRGSVVTELRRAA